MGDKGRLGCPAIGRSPVRTELPGRKSTTSPFPLAERSLHFCSFTRSSVADEITLAELVRGGRERWMISG